MEIGCPPQKTEEAQELKLAENLEAAVVVGEHDTVGTAKSDMPRARAVNVEAIIEHAVGDDIARTREQSVMRTFSS